LGSWGRVGWRGLGRRGSFLLTWEQDEVRDGGVALFDIGGEVVPFALWGEDELGFCAFCAQGDELGAWLEGKRAITADDHIGLLWVHHLNDADEGSLADGAACGGRLFFPKRGARGQQASGG
jgi:hypothetical protein